MTWLLLLGAAVFGGGAAQSAPLDPARSVPCHESIDSTRFPYVAGRYRLVLGAVSVPPAQLRQVVASGQRAWPYWAKAGLVVRGGGPAVTITVSAAWRDRVAIAWGTRGGGFSRLRIAGCPARANVGFAYAGGFQLRVRAACVPLVFSVGQRSATVRFGLGRACG